MLSDKRLTLKSSDGETFEVEETVCLESETIKHMVEDDCADTVIPLPNVTSTILSKVIEYCKNHVEGRKEQYDKSSEDELKKWDADFVNVDQKTLFDLIKAANYLHIKGLLDLTCKTAADMVRGMDPEAIPKLFNIENALTSEEEEDVRRENAWAFENSSDYASKEEAKALSRLRFVKKRRVVKWSDYTPEEEEEVRRNNPWAFTLMGNDTFGWRRRHWGDYTPEEEEEVRRENQWAFTAMGNDIVGRRRRHWNETAKKWLLIFGIGMYIVLYVIQFVRMLYRIIYLYE